MTSLLDEDLDWRLLPLLMLLGGLLALGWAIGVESVPCDPASLGYEDCTKTAAVTWEVGVLGVILIAAAVLTYWLANRRRRHQLSSTPPPKLGEG